MLLPPATPLPKTDFSSPTTQEVLLPPPSIPRKNATRLFYHKGLTLRVQAQVLGGFILDNCGDGGRVARHHRIKIFMGLNKLDFAIIAVYLAGITLFGLRFRKRQRSLRDYFLADRSIPWWAIALSIVAAETSTLTIISTPGLAYDTNLTFLQVVLGYLVGRVIISFVLLPHYFRGELYTAYELIERRFGRRLRSLTAGLFLLTRAAAEGVRIYAVSIVVGIALGTGEVTSIAIITALTLIYTFEGGLAAVIWTDVVQTIIYVGGTIVGVFTILHLVPGGWDAIQSTAQSEGKLHMFDFTPDFWRPYTFWAGVIGGTFLTTASHGTDQLIVQRLLAARNQKQSVTALLSSGVAILVQFGLFLLVGVMLFVYYHVPSATFGKADRIFPTFIVSQMPHGISGLLIAAILAAAMSNLSAALNSLSSTSMLDFYLRRNPQVDEARKLRLSRVSTMIWAVVLFGLAILSLHKVSRVIEVGLSIASVAYGSLLGVFLLGVLTRRANERGAIVGMVVGFAGSLFIWQKTSVPWTWYVALGSAETFLVGYLASLVYESQNLKTQRTQS
jgi:SSS family transporter